MFEEKVNNCSNQYSKIMHEGQSPAHSINDQNDKTPFLKPDDVSEVYVIEGNEIYLTPTLKTIYKEAYNLAQYDKQVLLLTGETGTGKELIPRFVHSASNRRNKKHIIMNCGSLTESVLQSNLFGHKRGSFTGAESDVKGFFAAANGSTLVLDEIENAPASLQQALLRVIETGELQILGTTEITRTDVSLIFTSNWDLKELVSDGSFREDLYYRISSYEIEIPPLRLYPETELRELVNHFLTIKAKEFKKDKILISEEVMQVVLNSSFEGNYRFFNKLNRVYINCRNEITMQDLQYFHLQLQDHYALNSKQINEKKRIEEALMKSGGNQTKAREYLSIKAPSTLRNKIKKYGILIPEK